MKKEMYFLLPYLEENGNKAISENNPENFNFLFGKIDTKKNAQQVIFSDKNECIVEMYVDGAQEGMETTKALHKNIAQNSHASYISHEIIYREKDYLKKRHWLKIRYGFNTLK